MLQIVSYDQLPVNNFTCAQGDTDPDSCGNFIDVTVLFNDVWVFDAAAVHASDCNSTAAWTQAFPQTVHGGCRVEVDDASGAWRQICSAPFERYLHTAVFHNGS